MENTCGATGIHYISAEGILVPACNGHVHNIGVISLSILRTQWKRWGSTPVLAFEITENVSYTTPRVTTDNRLVGRSVGFCFLFDIQPQHFYGFLSGDNKFELCGANLQKLWLCHRLFQMLCFTCNFIRFAVSTHSHTHKRPVSPEEWHINLTEQNRRNIFTSFVFAKACNFVGHAATSKT